MRPIGTIRGFDVLLSPWGYLEIDCLANSIPYWRENWEDIAYDYGIEVDQSEVDELLRKAAKIMEESRCI